MASVLGVSVRLRTVADELPVFGLVRDVPSVSWLPFRELLEQALGDLAPRPPEKSLRRSMSESASRTFTAIGHMQRGERSIHVTGVVHPDRGELVLRGRLFAGLCVS